MTTWAGWDLDDHGRSWNQAGVNQQSNGPKQHLISVFLANLFLHSFVSASSLQLILMVYSISGDF